MDILQYVIDGRRIYSKDLERSRENCDERKLLYVDFTREFIGCVQSTEVRLKTPKNCRLNFTTLKDCYQINCPCLLHPLGSYPKHNWSVHSKNVLSSPWLGKTIEISKGILTRYWQNIWFIFFSHYGWRGIVIKTKLNYPKTIFMIDENVKMINVWKQSRSDQSD